MQWISGGESIKFCPYRVKPPRCHRGFYEKSLVGAVANLGSHNAESLMCLDGGIPVEVEEPKRKKRLSVVSLWVSSFDRRSVSLGGIRSFPG